MPPRTGSRVLQLAARFAAIVGTLHVILLWLVWRDPAGLHYNDWRTFWEASHGWLTSGRSLYAPETAHTIREVAFTNLTLPHAHLPFMSVAWLPLELSATAWVAMYAGAVAATLQVIRRERGHRFTLLEWTAMLWSAPLQAQLITGQVAAFLLLPMALMWSSVRRNAWMSVGAWLGIAVGFKPILAPLMVWLVWLREWRAVAAAVAMLLAQVVCGVLLFGVDSYKEWSETVGAVHWTQPTMNASWWGLVTRLTQDSAFSTPLLDAPAIGRVLGVVGSMGIVVVTALACRKTRCREQQLWLVLLAALLVSPLGWVYYVLWCAPLVLTMAMPRIAAVCLLVPLIAMGPVPNSSSLTAIVGSAYSYGLLAWWAVLCRKGLRGECECDVCRLQSNALTTVSS